MGKGWDRMGLQQMSPGENEGSYLAVTCHWLLGYLCSHLPYNLKHSPIEPPLRIP